MIESMHGKMKKMPGPFAPPGRMRPRRKMTARSYSFTICLKTNWNGLERWVPPGEHRDWKAEKNHFQLWLWLLGTEGDFLLLHFRRRKLFKKIIFVKMCHSIFWFFFVLASRHGEFTLFTSFEDSQVRTFWFGFWKVTKLEPFGTKFRTFKL